MTSGLLMLAMAGSPDRAAMTSVLDDFTTSGTATAVLIAFLAGIALALWCLAVALWRSQLAPRWVPVVIAAVPLLDFTSNNMMLGVLGWLALTVALGRVGLGILVGLAEDAGSEPARVRM